jgi:hypothetical protein
MFYCDIDKSELCVLPVENINNFQVNALFLSYNVQYHDLFCSVILSVKAVRGEMD